MLHVIDDACYTYRSMKHTHAVDRWYMLYMLSIDDVCLTLCYRSTMHVLCYRSMMHNLWWCMLYMLLIDDACYMLSILDDACLCYRSTMHATCDRSMMHRITTIDLESYYTCCRSMMMHHIDLRCMLHMLLIDNVYTHATIDDAWYLCYRSMIHILAINLEARYILQQPLVKTIDLLHDTHTITVYMLHTIDRWCILWCCMLCA